MGITIGLVNSYLKLSFIYLFLFAFNNYQDFCILFIINKNIRFFCRRTYLNILIDGYIQR